MRSGKIRLLRLITRLNAGGAARHVVSLSRGLQEKGYETLLVSGEAAHGESDLSALAGQEGVPLRRIRTLSREIDPLADAAALMEMRTLVREFDPDIIDTHTAKAGLVGRLVARAENALRPPRARIRTVHTFHGNVLSGYFPSWKEIAFRWIERRLGRNASDAIVVLSAEQRAEIVDRFRVAPPESVYVMPLGMDLSSFEKLPARGAFRNELGFGEDAFVVGIVGRIAPIKNHEMFVRAAARTLRSIPKSRFVVVGDGEGAESLRRLAASLYLGEAIRFVGFRTDLASVYSGLDAVALTSRNEGTPLSLIEAMACGKPIVATDVGGVRDILTREWAGPVTHRHFARSETPRGLLVPSGDVAEFARSLVAMAGDADARAGLGEAGRAYAFRYHALPRLLDDADGLYRQILAGPARMPAGN